MQRVLIANDLSPSDKCPFELLVMDVSPSRAFVKVRFLSDELLKSRWIPSDYYQIIEVLTNEKNEPKTAGTPPDR